MFQNVLKKKEKLSKAGRFSSRDEVFIWKILSRLCWDLVLNKRGGRDGMKNVPASYT